MNQSVLETLESLFDKSIQNYQNDEYEKALELINKCIQLQPQNSDILTNRALIKAKLNKLNDAIEDLQKAINHCPYNYVPYFNLSSVYFKKGNKYQALKNICCSLSCLYVAKSRFTQDLIDMSMGLFYAENNVDGHVLKAMIYLKRGNSKTSLQSLNRALQIDKSNQVLRQIHSSVYRQLFPYHDSPIYQENQEENNQTLQKLRLKWSYQNYQQDRIDDLIEQKMSEFNKLLLQVKQLESNQKHQAKQIRAVNQLWDQGEDKTFQIRKSHRC